MAEPLGEVTRGRYQDILPTRPSWEQKPKVMALPGWLQGMRLICGEFFF